MLCYIPLYSTLFYYIIKSAWPGLPRALQSVACARLRACCAHVSFVYNAWLIANILSLTSHVSYLTVYDISYLDSNTCMTIYIYTFAACTHDYILIYHPMSFLHIMISIAVSLHSVLIQSDTDDTPWLHQSQKSIYLKHNTFSVTFERVSRVSAANVAHVFAEGIARTCEFRMRCFGAALSFWGNFRRTFAVQCRMSFASIHLCSTLLKSWGLAPFKHVGCAIDFRHQST